MTEANGWAGKAAGWLRAGRGVIADVTAIAFLGDKPFLSGFPTGIALHHAGNYLLIAALAVVAALMGLAFKAVLYAAEDLCDRAWKGRPEWARPAVGGVVLGLLLLAVPQMYGVGYPVMDKATSRTTSSGRARATRPCTRSSRWARCSPPPPAPR